jgi:hypothetical protein
MQAITTIFTFLIVFGFPSLYATLVCVACSQLEKLRAALLDITQTHVMTEQETGGHEYSDRQTHISEEVFQLMPKQLKVCIRHHQETKRCERMKNLLIQTANFVLEKRNILHNNFTFFRFMAVLEDTLNIPLCGIFLILLSFMCLDAFSIVTVNILSYFTIQLKEILFMTFVFQEQVEKLYNDNIMNESIHFLISSHGEI